MSKSNIWIVILLALAVGGFIWAIDENNKRKIFEKKLVQKETDYLTLLQSFLENRKTIPNEIKQQLIQLRERYTGLQDDVANKLKIIVELLEEGKEEIAIEKLTTVIENLLKEKFVAEQKAKDKKSCPILFKMLETALALNWISKHEYYVSCFLKDQRNEEAHEITAKFPTNWKYIAFLAGIELIYNLKGIKR
jgi:hypothetical protein